MQRTRLLATGLTHFALLLAVPAWHKSISSIKALQPPHAEITTQFAHNQAGARLTSAVTCKKDSFSQARNFEGLAGNINEKIKALILPVHSPAGFILQCNPSAATLCLCRPQKHELCSDARVQSSVLTLDDGQCCLTASLASACR